MNKELVWQSKEFKFGSITVSYPKPYYQFIKECFIFDVYRTDLLKEGDVVVDLGAAVGEFTIMASKKVGNNGLIIAIEPNPQDFELLNENVTRNKCHNVILVNKGVGSVATQKEISFWGRKFTADLDTLGNIMRGLGLNKDVNFMKMDIEGYETDVISNDTDIIKKADVISVELHNTKNEVDKILWTYGFDFEALSATHCIKNLVKNTLFSHLGLFLKVVAETISNNPKLLYKLVVGYEMGEIIDNPTQPYWLLMGTYIRKDSQRSS